MNDMIYSGVVLVYQASKPAILKIGGPAVILMASQITGSLAKTLVTQFYYYIFSAFHFFVVTLHLLSQTCKQTGSYSTLLHERTRIRFPHRYKKPCCCRCHKGLSRRRYQKCDNGRDSPSPQHFQTNTLPAFRGQGKTVAHLCLHRHTGGNGTDGAAGRQHRQCPGVAFA